jgi:hypothetical protein
MEKGTSFPLKIALQNILKLVLEHHLSKFSHHKPAIKPLLSSDQLLFY